VRAETRHQLKADRFSKVHIRGSGKRRSLDAEHQAKLIAAELGHRLSRLLHLAGGITSILRMKRLALAFDGSPDV